MIISNTFSIVGFFRLFFLSALFSSDIIIYLVLFSNILGLSHAIVFWMMFDLSSSYSWKLFLVFLFSRHLIETLFISDRLVYGRFDFSSSLKLLKTLSSTNSWLNLLIPLLLCLLPYAILAIGLIPFIIINDYFFWGFILRFPLRLKSTTLESILR